eukprot:8174569-Alexandrium_andersonii.AAC.1
MRTRGPLISELSLARGSGVITPGSRRGVSLDASDTCVRESMYAHWRSGTHMHRSDRAACVAQGNRGAVACAFAY